jgi:hypothetical protein
MQPAQNRMQLQEDLVPQGLFLPVTPSVLFVVRHP